MPVDERTAVADAAKIFDQAAAPVETQDPGPAVEETAESQPAETPEAEAAETQETDGAEDRGPEETGEPAEEAEPPEPAEASPEGDEPPEFTRLFKEDKDLNAFLKSHRNHRDNWFKAAQMLDQFPTVDDAKAAREALVEINEFDRLFQSSRPEDKHELITRLAKSSQDPATGRSSGQYEALANAILDDMTAQLSRAARSGQLRLPQGWQNEHYQAAIAGLRASLGMSQVDGQNGLQAGATQQGADAPQFDQRAAELTRREQEMNERQDKMFADSIDARYSDFIGRKVTGLVDSSPGLKAQPKGFQEYVKNQILDQLKEAMWSDELFRGQFDSKARSGGRSAQEVSDLAGMLQKRAEHYLPGIQRKVFREAGAQIQANEAAEDAKRAAVPKRKEVAASANAAKLSSPASGQNGRPKMNPGESIRSFERRVVREAMDRAGV